MKKKTTLIEVLIKYINEDTFVWVGKPNTRGKHFHSVNECILQNINHLNKRVKDYIYYIDGLLEIDF